MNPTERWYPYYAGYAPGFVSGLLDAVSDSSCMLLDPWNGSGTTTSTASAHSVSAVGVDANPAAVLIASAKLADAADAGHVCGLVDEICDRASRADAPEADDPLLAWLNPVAASFVRGAQQEIGRLLARGPNGVVVDPAIAALPPLAAFVALALARAVRSCAPPTLSSNPTWIRPAEKRRITRRQVWLAFRTTVVAMANDLAVMNRDRSPQSAKVLLGDARSLPLAPKSVDLVISSPPYLTRIDYAVTTALELAVLGIRSHSSALSKLRRSLMGTPLSRDRAIQPPRKDWPSSIKRLLSLVQKHPSKDSAGYYYKHYWQYFDDTQRSLASLARVIKPRGAAILVLQNSYYKDVLIDLPLIFSSFGDAAGFKIHMTQMVPVTRTLTSINSRAQLHQPERSYHESVLVMERM